VHAPNRLCQQGSQTGSYFYGCILVFHFEETADWHAVGLWLQVGGLGDVVTSLARAVEEAGHCVEVILPKYNNLDYSQVRQPRFPNTHDRLSMMHAQILHQIMLAASSAG
jgi:hypothetical protein